MDVLPLLARHFKNPKASSDSDTVLALKLKHYDAPNGKTFIFEVPEGATFRLYNGKLFRKAPKEERVLNVQNWPPVDCMFLTPMQKLNYR